MGVEKIPVHIAACQPSSQLPLPIFFSVASGNFIAEAPFLSILLLPRTGPTFVLQGSTTTRVTMGSKRVRIRHQTVFLHCSASTSTGGDAGSHPSSSDLLSCQVTEDCPVPGFLLPASFLTQISLFISNQVRMSFYIENLMPWRSTAEPYLHLPTPEHWLWTLPFTPKRPINR